MKKSIRLFVFASIIFSCEPRKDTEMNRYISNLMGQMTIEEKIGQLNLITPGGGIPTGSVVSTDVEAKIKA